MNSIPKYVASTTLRELTWNATVIDGDVASFVDDLKRNAGQNLLKYLLVFVIFGRVGSSGGSLRWAGDDAVGVAGFV